MRVLLIGLGDIAQKAYLPVLSRRADLDIHLATRDQVVLDAIGSAFRIEHRHASATDALSATSFDAASVHAATPAHADLIRLLIKRGVPTFVDKPLADNLDDVEALVALAKARAVPLTVGFNRRFAPDYVALRGIGADLILMEKHRFRQPDAPRRVVFDDFIHVGRYAVVPCAWCGPPTHHRNPCRGRLAARRHPHARWRWVYRHRHDAP